MLAQLYSKCEVKALCHRVVNTPETIKNGRYSIVLFIDFGDLVFHKGAFGNLQNLFPEGQNYDIAYETFEKYFTRIENRVL